jgi:adenylyltransferase/sulfurtransferase
LDFISRYDIIVDAADNTSSNYLINDSCLIAGKPWVYGSVSKFEGQVSTFNCHNSPSLRCLFPYTPESTSDFPPQTGMLGVLPGIIGSIQAAEVIKIITGIGKPLLGKLLVYNMLTHIINTVPFEKILDNFKINSLQKSY